MRSTTASTSTDDLVLGGAVVTTALLAGLYYGFSVAIMPGLRHADDATFVGTMQGVNDAIVNPAFMVAFLGAPILTGVLAWRWMRGSGSSRAGRRGARLVLAALVLHVAGLALTAGANVPLNDRLAHAGTPAHMSAAHLHEARAAYEGPWTRRHLLRTGVTVAALGLLAGAAVTRRRSEASATAGESAGRGGASPDQRRLYPTLPADAAATSA